MLSNSPRITLLAPGCFSATAQPDEDAISRIDDAPAALDINDAVAIATQSTSYEQALATALNQPVPALGDIPIAQYRYLCETGISAPEHCVCAELIHLQADKDNARLLPFAALSVREAESEALIESLNQLINPDGLQIEHTGNGHYYLCGMAADNLDTWPAHAVANGKIANYLPRDSKAGDWRRLLTEVQMLFHAHPVNAARAASGQLPINAMWFWGGAKSDVLPPVTNTLLVANDAYVLGLAHELNLPVMPLEDFQWDKQETDVVIVDTTVYDAWISGDQESLSQKKALLQTRWIQPAQQRVANEQAVEFVLDGCEGQAIVETLISPPAGLSFKSLFSKKWFTQQSTKSKTNKPTPKAKK